MGSQGERKSARQREQTLRRPGAPSWWPEQPHDSSLFLSSYCIPQGGGGGGVGYGEGQVSRGPLPPALLGSPASPTYLCLIGLSLLSGWSAAVRLSGPVFPFALIPVSLAQSLLRTRLCAKRFTRVLVESSWRPFEGSGRRRPSVWPPLSPCSQSSSAPVPFAPQTLPTEGGVLGRALVWGSGGRSIRPPSAT